MDRIYDNITLGGISRKRFVESSNNSMAGAGRLRLVVVKKQSGQIQKNTFIDEIVEKRARPLLFSPDAVLVRRFSSGRIVFWNRGAHRLYGWSKKKAMGRLVYKLLRTEFLEAPRDIKAKLRRNHCWSGELVQTRKDGKKIVVASHWSLRQNVNGGPLDVLEVNYNAMDRKQGGQKAQESERFALLGNTAANFADNVAIHIAGLSASLQFVELDFQTKQFKEPLVRGAIQSALRKIDRLGSVVNDFRSFERQQALNLRLTDLEKIVEEVLAVKKIAYQAAGITVKIEFERGLPPIRLDAVKIKQAILNLCNNAIEAMREGGCLTLRGYRTDRMVALEISDNGIGVADGVNIFKLFKTTKPGGSVLGLPFVQQIVSAHNGTIHCTTQPGQGTTFKLSLPAANQAM